VVLGALLLFALLLVFMLIHYSASDCIPDVREGMALMHYLY